MKTPNMAETLRDEAKRSERLRIILYLTQTADYTTEACPEPYIRSSFIYYTTYF